MSTGLDNLNTMSSGGIIFFIIITVLAMFFRMLDFLPDVVINIVLIFNGVAILCIWRYDIWRSESNNG